MIFNSLHFAAFFVVVWTLVVGLRKHVRARNGLLIAAGYYFYAWWDWRFLGLLIFTTLFDYLCGRLLGDLDPDHHREPAYPHLLPGEPPPTVLHYESAYRIQRARRDRLILAASIVVNLAVLGFFKYFSFFADSAAVLMARLGLDVQPAVLNVVLPVGISFYTFQSMSYIIDVYRGVIPSEKRLLNYAAFVAFFPPLVAGPIERAANLLPQMRTPNRVTLDGFYSGCYWILWGLFKKIVIADNIAPLVNGVFGDFRPYPPGTALPQTFPGGGAAILAVWAFAIQIYCDFSGYTDMARGVARCMGFELIRNFDLPYFATNPSDFWRRWHISLSTWLRDYVYIPLGGNRRGTVRTYLNLFLTMVIGGLWHGAAWTFVLWGAFHGLLLCIHRALKPLLDRSIPVESPVSNGLLWRVIRTVGFFQLVAISWLLFRCESMGQLTEMCRAIVTSPLTSDLKLEALLPLICGAIVLLGVQLAQAMTGQNFVFRLLPTPLRAGVYAALLLTILIYGDTGGRAFIYFQF